VTKLEKTVLRLDKLKTGCVILSIVDIFFYCSHQLLHQDVSKISTNLEYLISYVVSWIVLLYISVEYTVLYYRLYKLDKRELLRHYKKS
jgi:hypothetical protein